MLSAVVAPSLLPGLPSRANHGKGSNGKPAVVRRVLKEGANNGRRFYACPGSKQVKNQMATLLIVCVAAFKFFSKAHWPPLQCNASSTWTAAVDGYVLLVCAREIRPLLIDA